MTVRPARLDGHAVRWARGESFPLLVAEDGAAVEGLLLDAPNAQALARVDFYEAAFGYVRRPVTVTTEAGPVEAQVYVPPGDMWPVGAPWALNDWVQSWGTLTLRAAAEVMDRFGQAAPQEVGRHFTQTRMRAASWRRAQEDSVPNVLRSGLTQENVATAARRRPYAQFFMVEEQDLRFQRFDGSHSDTVTRAAFVMADAVTVLPYDPVRDRVLLVEQFRFGPLARGDRHPWSLEPIAGRIDPGETPEAAARRETAEESGLTLDRLELVARYYPSPAAVSEYLFSYIGIADLPDGVARVSGLASEAEDIRGIVLEMAEVHALMASGEAENGPLILSLHWLLAHRDRLRQGA